MSDWVYLSFCDCFEILFSLNPRYYAFVRRFRLLDYCRIKCCGSKHWNKHDYPHSVFLIINSVLIVQCYSYHYWYKQALKQSCPVYYNLAVRKLRSKIFKFYTKHPHPPPPSLPLPPHRPLKRRPDQPTQLFPSRLKANSQNEGF